MDIRAWKARKRIQRMRNEGGGWPRSLLFIISALLTLTGALSSVLGCLPLPGMVPVILATWLFATLGGATALWLHAIRQRYALVLLTVVGLSMIISLVAAIVRVLITAPH